MLSNVASSVLSINLASTINSTRRTKKVIKYINDYFKKNIDKVNKYKVGDISEHLVVCSNIINNIKTDEEFKKITYPLYYVTMANYYCNNNNQYHIDDGIVILICKSIKKYLKEYKKDKENHVITTCNTFTNDINVDKEVYKIIKKCVNYKKLFKFQIITKNNKSDDTSEDKSDDNSDNSDNSDNKSDDKSEGYFASLSE